MTQPDLFGELDAAEALAASAALDLDAQPLPDPNRKNTGDIDKLTRQLLDALTDAKVLNDDSRVVMLQVAKVYETPDRRPGVTVYVASEGNPHPHILTALLTGAPELQELKP